MSPGRKSCSCPRQPCSALGPAWPNSLASRAPSRCPRHPHKMSCGLRFLTSEPVATAQCLQPLLLNLGVVKHLRSNRPQLLGLAEAACLRPASFAGYSTRNWIHMGQIPPTLISHGSGFGTKQLRAVETLLLPWGRECSHQVPGDDSSLAKDAASAFKVYPIGSAQDKDQGREEPATSVSWAWGKAGSQPIPTAA